MIFFRDNLEEQANGVRSRAGASWDSALEQRKLAAVTECIIPVFSGALCWATTNLPEHWLLKRRKALLTNSHGDDFANVKHDVISFYL
jgi:hypothetical protein